LEKEYLVVGLKGPDAKTKCLAVNSQSKSNFDFELTGLELRSSKGTAVWQKKN
jgi:hypothetical protein